VVPTVIIRSMLSKSVRICCSSSLRDMGVFLKSQYCQ
jgi:hypothetical protein